MCCAIRPRAEQGFQARGCLCCASASCSSCGARVSGSFVCTAVRPRGIVSAEHAAGSWDVVGGLSAHLAYVSRCFRCREWAAT
jgi:hypothetical protein